MWCDYLKYLYVVVYATMTVDGKIASKVGYSKLSCTYDLRRLHSVRASSDAVLVGANTVLKDDPLLTVRLVEGKNPLRVIVDGRLRTPVNARVYNTLHEAPTIVYTSIRAEPKKIRLLRSRGVEVVVFNEYPIPMDLVLRDLYKRGVRSLLVEGGGETIWFFVKERLFDELRITISPYVFGGHKAVSIVGGEGFRDTNDAVRLRLLEARLCECGREIHLRYVLEK